LSIVSWSHLAIEPLTRVAVPIDSIGHGTMIQSPKVSGPEGHAHAAQQGPCLVVGFRRGHDGDVHSLQLLDLGIVNLRKDELVLEAERVITAPIKRFGGDAAEV